MAARLTDLQKKQIIGAYEEIGNYSVVGKKFGVTGSTVKRIVEKEKAESEEAKDTADILTHVAQKKGEVIELMDVYLQRLQDPKVVEGATPSQLTSVLSMLIDKFMTAIPAEKQQEAHRALVEAIRGRYENRENI
jgi:hypothetical protein